MPAPAQFRRHPDALNLAGQGGHRADLGLEDHLALLDPGVGAPRPDQLRHARPVRRSPVRPDRRYPDLLGEHGHGRGQQRVNLVRPDQAHQRVGRHQRFRGDCHDRLHGPDLTGTPPVRGEQPPELLNGAGGPDDRRAATALQPGALRERRHGARRRGHGHQVGARVAQRRHPPGLQVSPHLGAEPTRVNPGRMHPRADEDVRDRIAVADFEDLVPIAIIEQA